MSYFRFLRKQIQWAVRQHICSKCNSCDAAFFPQHPAWAFLLTEEPGVWNWLVDTWHLGYMLFIHFFLSVSCFLTLYPHHLYSLFISTFCLSINHLCHLYLSFISVHISCLCAAHTTQGVFILSSPLREKAILYFQIPSKSTRWFWSKVPGWLMSGPCTTASKSALCCLSFFQAQ